MVPGHVAEGSLGAPSFAYQVDYFTIDRNGAVTFDDRADSEEIENLIERLSSMGFEAEPVECAFGSGPCRRGQ